MDKLNESLRISLKKTKIQASENLQHRVMQQIQTESALQRKISRKRSFSVLKSLGTTMAIAYTLIGILWIYVYRTTEVTSNSDTLFYTAVMAISAISFSIWAICTWDNLRAYKLNRE